MSTSMSRRVRIVILTVFMVLMGVVGVDMVRAWRVENPLRCTIAADADIITLENTSRFPVIVYSAFTTNDPIGSSRQNISALLFAAQSRKVKGRKPYELIPPGGRFQQKVGPVIDSRSLRSANSRVSYGWNSRPRHGCRVVYYWCLDLLPKSWRARLPYPQMTKGSAPLLPAARSEGSGDSHTAG